MSGAQPPPPVTADLAEAVGVAARTGAPDEVRQHVLRRLLGVLGAGIGAAGAPPVEILVRCAESAGPPGTSPVPGRRERLSASSSALVSGYAAYLGANEDGRWTTADPYPDAAVLGAAMPLLASSGAAPLRLLDALALGIEVQLRLAAAMAPSHHDEGWHATGTVGPIGAAVTAALLQDLDDERLRNAIATASSTSSGQRQAVGTPLEPLHSGKAAANGLLAAGLASRGFTGAPAALEGPRGWFFTLAPSLDLSDLIPEPTGPWRLLDAPAGADLGDRAVERCERRLPGRGATLLRAVQQLPDGSDCSALLAAIDPEDS